MNNELTDKQKAIIEKVAKLLEVRTDRGASEQEQANAIDLATKLMEAHNLDMSNIERAGAKGSGKREDKKKSGGLYQWQRDVWAAVAKLNFCVHQSVRGLTRGAKYEHRVIGRVENVLATELMAHYLEQAINRLAKEWVLNRYGPGTSVFIREAIGYREGLAMRVAERVNALRYQREQESKAKAAEAAAAAKHPGAAPGTGLVLVSVIQNEADLNNDFMKGWEPGTTQRRREEAEARSAQWEREWEREWEERQAAAQKADDEWKERDPEGWAAAKQAEADERRKREDAAIKREARNAKRRKGVSHYSHKAYTEKDAARDRGYRDGDQISLNDQIDGDTKARIG